MPNPFVLYSWAITTTTHVTPAYHWTIVFQCSKGIGRGTYTANIHQQMLHCWRITTSQAEIHPKKTKLRISLHYSSLLLGNLYTHFYTPQNLFKKILEIHRNNPNLNLQGPSYPGLLHHRWPPVHHPWGQQGHQSWCTHSGHLENVATQYLSYLSNVRIMVTLYPNSKVAKQEYTKHPQTALKLFLQVLEIRAEKLIH